MARSTPARHRDTGHAEPRPTIERIGALVTERLEATPAGVVVVIAPGPSGDAVATRIAAAHSDAGGRTVTVAASRSDRLRAGSTEARIAAREQPGTLLVVVEAQWADDESLAALAARVDTLADDQHVVVVHRPTGPPPSLAVIGLTARRRGAVIALEPSTAADLIEAGRRRDEADSLVAVTDGWPDLIDAIDADGSLQQEVAARLSVLDEHGRRAAELVAFGAGVERIGGLLGVEPGTHDRVVDDLAAEGLLHTGTMVAGVADMVRRVATPARRAQVVELLAEHGAPGTTPELARLLRSLDDRTPAAGQLFVRVATSLAAIEPTEALGFVDAARQAGAGGADLVACEAVACLATGDPQRALRVLHDAGPDPDLEAIRATAWAAVGDLEAAAACLERSSLPDLAVWASTGAGRPSAERSPSAAADAGAAASVAGGIDAWRAGRPGDVFERLKRAAIRYRTEPDPGRWPVTPDLLTALLAVRLGDLGEAERVIAAAIGDDVGGHAHRRSHLLVAAWVAARRGHLDDAAAALGQLGAATLSPQEQLWRAAAECAIAVRDAETDGLEPAVRAATTALGAVNTHLYDLDLLTDAAAAMVRTRASVVGDPFAPVAAVIDRLDRPAAFAHDLAWARLSAALAGDDLDAIAARAASVVALDDPAPSLPHVGPRRRAAAVLCAARAGSASADETERAARDLAEAGATHEAARLCGLVALRMQHEGDTRRLLKESRTWRAQRTQLKTAAGADRSVIRLSEQEERVAQMVLDGHTHKQIGSALFISAKTVEHHVAHIRTKLDAGSRAELLAAIRTYLAGR